MNQVIATFKTKGANMRATVEELKIVMEAIGNERFQELAAKMVQMDAVHSSNVTILNGMPKLAIDELRDKAFSQD